jgi:hypothetical protein
VVIYVQKEIDKGGSKMDAGKMLEELRTEREQLVAAIAALEKLQWLHGEKRRGRPPGSSNKADAEKPASVAVKREEEG